MMKRETSGVFIKYLPYGKEESLHTTIAFGKILWIWVALYITFSPFIWSERCFWYLEHMHAPLLVQYILGHFSVNYVIDAERMISTWNATVYIHSFHVRSLPYSFYSVQAPRVRDTWRAYNLSIHFCICASTAAESKKVVLSKLNAVKSQNS